MSASGNLAAGVGTAAVTGCDGEDGPAVAVAGAFVGLWLPVAGFAADVLDDPAVAAAVAEFDAPAVPEAPVPAPPSFSSGEGSFTRAFSGRSFSDKNGISTSSPKRSTFFFKSMHACFGKTVHLSLRCCCCIRTARHTSNRFRLSKPQSRSTSLPSMMVKEHCRKRFFLASALLPTLIVAACTRPRIFAVPTPFAMPANLMESGSSIDKKIA